MFENFEQTDKIQLSGTVENIVYRSTLNGYCVFELSVSNGEFSEVICTATIPTLQEGESIKVIGNYVMHPTYGRQLNVEFYEKTLPETEIAIEKYLGSGLIKGVRARLARKIVATFGAQTLSIIEDYPEKLTEIKGITMEKALTISSVFNEQTQMRKVILYLQKLGISNNFAMKIYSRYKDKTIETVQDNPYKLADDIIGIGFKVADSIAERAGIGKDAKERVYAGVKYALTQAAGNGHVYLPKEMLLQSAAELLELPFELIENALVSMQMERIIWQEKKEDVTVVYLNGYFYAENNVAKKLVELSAHVVKKSRNVAAEIAKLEKLNDISLAKNQKEAVIAAMDHGVLVVTGGPGTGKTTTINTIINILQKDGYSIELAAPTGRAAKKMTEATGMDAKTIHRLLEISFSKNENRPQTFAKNKDNPLETDVLIVDESSMVDILLMNNLLSALALGTRLILVGDIDQLPSVGAGNVLKDIIHSGCLPIVRLNEVFRQAQESAIVMNAHRINKGEYPIINDKSKDFFFMQKAAIPEVLETIVELVTKRLPKFANCDPLADIQVLAPMRKTPLGVANLNTILQKELNPPDVNKKEREFRGIVYREGDKVMQIKNNYNMIWKSIDKNGRLLEDGVGIFNGDTGIIKKIDDYSELMIIVFDETKHIEYDYTQLDELELAYAITIHKSQGSEYKVVVMPIHSGPNMLMTRNLLYTGVTRAKELTVIVGMFDTVKRMIDNKQEINRFSSLDERIVKMQKIVSGEIHV